MLGIEVITGSELRDNELQYTLLILELVRLLTSSSIYIASIMITVPICTTSIKRGLVFFHTIERHKRPLS